MKLFYLIVPVFIVSIMTIGCSQPPNEFKKRPNHIVIVVEENHNYDQIMNNADAPYINKLIKGGLLLTNSHGITHPSQPNYIALFSGSTQGVSNDRCLKDDGPYSTANLGHELLTNGYTFTGYSENIPEKGFTGCDVGRSSYPNGGYLYGRLHNPWANWQGNTPTGLPASTNMKFVDFPTDFDNLPTISFVVPNKDNDMHNGPDSLSIKRGDDWLKKHMAPYINWAKEHNSLFILTYDEDNGTKDNHILTLFAGARIKAEHNDLKVNHYNLLRTIEQLYNLPNAGPATEKAIPGIWNEQQQQSDTEEPQKTASLKLNEIQVVGTHNSYKVAIDSALMAIIRQKNPAEARALSYAHLPVSEQLDKGARNLEYDVYYDPEGSRFKDPYGLELLKEKGLPYKPFDPSGKLSGPGLKVFHIPGLDFRSHHLLFRDALKELRSWSGQHPNHIPIFITMNTKDGSVAMKGISQPLPFTKTALDSIDLELEKYLGKDHLITPNMVRKKGKTLKQSIMEKGWPQLDILRGRFLFILDQSGEKMKRYINHHPSLKGRMMFVNAPQSYSEAATMIINDPIAKQKQIQEMVRHNFIVRTRADASTEEARHNDYKRWEAAKKSGAQIITTDYIVPSQTFSSPYKVGFDSTYRINTISK